MVGMALLQPGIIGSLISGRETLPRKVMVLHHPHQVGDHANINLLVRELMVCSVLLTGVVTQCLMSF